jgi:DNA invertase Pin-like site-specific DNA recombinase
MSKHNKVTQLVSKTTIKTARASKVTVGGPKKRVLTIKQAEAIRTLNKMGYSGYFLAKLFGAHQSTVYQIIRNETYVKPAKVSNA